MPQTVIPLMGPYTQRNMDANDSLSAGKDQRFSAVILTPVVDTLSEQKLVYCEKRAGLTQNITSVASGKKGTASFTSSLTGSKYSAFFTGSTNTLYQDSAGAVGTTDSGDRIIHITEARLSSIDSGTSTLLVQTNGASSYYFSQGISLLVNTFTANTTSGSAVLTSVSSTTGLFSGQRITGTGIPANTRIQSVDSASQITMTANATANGTGITVTKEHLAKILDSDFPTSPVGPMVEMDGYVFVTNGETIYHSDLNDVRSWSASARLPVNIKTGFVSGLAKYKNLILAIGNGGIEFFRNTGNPSGSVLSRVGDAFIELGPLGGGGISYPQFVQHRDYIFFVCSTTRAGGSGVWMVDKLQLKKISTPVIDRIITQTFSSDSVISAFEYLGKTLVHIGSSSVSTLYTSFLYCVESGEWFEGGFLFNLMFSANNANPLAVELNGTNGHLYEWSSDLANNGTVYQDAGSAYTMTIQTRPHVLNNGKGFTINAIDLLADTQSSGTTTLEKSTNDYGSFSTVGTFDMTAAQKRIHRGGYCKNHAIFRLTHSANTAWRGQALVVDWEPCVH